MAAGQPQHAERVSGSERAVDMGRELMTGEDALRSQWPTIASFLTCGARRNIRRETSSGMGGKGDRSVRATERWNSENRAGAETWPALSSG